MLTSERKRRILDLLRHDGRVVAKDLALELGLSEDTIRRDLREMAAEGLLARVHGGALPLAPDLPDFFTRRQVALAEKEHLAIRAANLIGPNMLVFIDGGTTNEALVRHLPRNSGLTVATHSPTIAAALEDRADIEVWLIGGRLYRHSMVAVGSSTAMGIRRLRPDIAFLGVTAVHPSHGFTTGDPEEAAIKTLIAEQSRQVWILVTAAKLDAVSPCVILPLEGVTGVVLSAEASPEQSSVLERNGLQLIRP
jgi:DeoR/GlpR family transcriptional regulator of sugar metabolism